MGYDTDLTDEQWRLIRRHIPKAKHGGRPRETSMRRVVDAIMYVVTHGCKWRGLPKDFPPWRTVYGYFADLQKRGRWRKIHYDLYSMVRKAAGRDEQPSLLVIDSQSVKTGKCASAETRGYDGGKRVKGRKRFIATDSLGLLVDVSMTTANRHDTKGGKKVLDKYRKRVKKSRVEKVVADKGFRGNLLTGFVKSAFKAVLEIGQNHTTAKTGFVPAKNRWVVERGFAWLGDYRRLTIDYERKLAHSCTMVRLAFIRLMLRRLVPV
ncbi:IS5 family transposase [Komagataeibacter sp. FNDCR2]|uniref:IS5 family transposase n=1 Tax=Komagataeibacter sp. FNDCR2 TaxID=2878682 RepID=UPI001E61A5BB|nr:IS5 family transposase [Komagataeibacter sp. FNDCR2]MCE2575275.1 IS5 family transposase [Komagataeibacter sp. FNDCR2]